MYDPLTVAWEIKRPWPTKRTTLGRYYPALLVVWHKDPELCGNDDSCNWFRARSRPFLAKVKWYNRFLHPKYHFWHWQLQVPALQNLKRWLFSRCGKCGNRFPYGYCPVSTSWDGDGPRWFRGEKHVYHNECLRDSYKSPVSQ